jgi:transcriptional regulator of aromatic amino acid metabolism
MAEGKHDDLSLMNLQFRPEDLVAILDGISDTVVTLDRKASYTAINRAAAWIFRELGRTPEEMIGKSAGTCSQR